MAKTISGVANMSKVTVRTYNNSGEYDSTNFRVGYYNNIKNYRFKIYFTPSVNLSQVKVKLQATSYSNKYTKSCSYELTNVATGEVYNDSTFYWAGTGAANAYTLTFTRTFKAGTQYSLYIGPPWDEYNMHIATSASYITITSTIQKYTVTFNGNGGSTTKTSQTVNSGNSCTLPTTSECTRSGYKLLGWSTNSSATSATYNPGASYKPTANITLYAVWEVSGLVYIDNGTELVAYLIYIDNGTGWDQYIPYIDNGSDWDICT